MANDLGYTPLANVAYKDPVTVGWGQQVLDNTTALVLLMENYKDGVQVIWNAVDSVKVTTGAIMINGKLRKNTSDITVTWGMTGGNGVAEATSTGYYIWAVASGSTSTFECAINQTSASMTGNANSRLIGWFHNDSGTTGNIDGLWYVDKDKRRHYESDWININVDANISKQINMGTDRVFWTMQFSTASNGEGVVLCEQQPNTNQGIGCFIGDISSTHYVLKAGHNFVAEENSGAAVHRYTSGYARILMSTINSV